MAVKLKPERGPRPRIAITVEAVEAYKARDYLRLHRALGLPPWEESPLHAETSWRPLEVPKDRHSWWYSIWQAQELAHALDIEVLKQAKRLAETPAPKAEA